MTSCKETASFHWQYVEAILDTVSAQALACSAIHLLTLPDIIIQHFKLLVLWSI